MIGFVFFPSKTTPRTWTRSHPSDKDPSPGAPSVRGDPGERSQDGAPSFVRELRWTTRRCVVVSQEPGDIIARMFRCIACWMIVCTGTVYGAVKHVPIRSGVVLKPGEAYTAQVESAKLVEIGWTAVQAKRCTMDCVQMTLMSGT